jgi:hypothetical protein
VWAQTDCTFLYSTYIVRFPSINANNEQNAKRKKETACLNRMKTIAKITTEGNVEDTVRGGI